MSNQVETSDGEANARTYQQVSEVLQQCASRCREMHSTQQQQMQVLVEVVRGLGSGTEPWLGKGARAFEEISWNKVGENFSGIALALQWGAETLDKMVWGLEAREGVRAQVERMRGQQSQLSGVTEGERAAFEQGLTQALGQDIAAKWQLASLAGTLSEQLEVAAGQVGSCSTGKHRGSWPFGGPGDGSMRQDDGSGGEPGESDPPGSAASSSGANGAAPKLPGLVYTLDTVDQVPFKRVLKTEPIKVRLLTQQDYEVRGGVIQTLEGPKDFRPGDYLAVGVEGEEWPIKQKNLTAPDYVLVTEAGSDGFAVYRAETVREAYQVPEPFVILKPGRRPVIGKAGDYLVRLVVKGEVRLWRVQETIYDKTYEDAP